ncbi:MAG TPA: beta-propeller fold lactonase family protein [Vicinamibacteria bacterium]|nr:beta-propeller fold lactonase family protein [Vicinamibacteria bacterium]
MNKRSFSVLACLCLFVATADAKERRRSFSGAVYTATNAPSGNEILIFDRLADGRLVPAGASGTGGLGTGTGLGNQGGLILTGDEKWLLAVNAGSDEISVFRVRRRGIQLVDVEPSNGSMPISLTEDDGLVYVLNAGSDSITGFWLERDGNLSPISGSTRLLSGSGAGPAQISFDPRGKILVVTEKATNNIVTFEVGRNGLPGNAQVQDSNGETPFGFAFGKRGQLFVSEAFGGAPEASAVSSYDVGRDGEIETISASVGTTETAACWVVVTGDGRFAYTTNTGSGSISGYSIEFDGEIELLDDDGRTGETGSGSSPIDMSIAGRFLYSLNGGTGTIGVFRISHDGSLVRLPFASSLPAGVNGLAAR